MAAGGCERRLGVCVREKLWCMCGIVRLWLGWSCELVSCVGGCWWGAR